MHQRPITVVGVGLATAILALAGCAGSTPSSGEQAGSPTVAATDGSPLSLVVVGDSIPYGQQFCAGCITFVDQYAAALKKQSGRPVEATNRSRDDSATIPDIVEQLTSDDELRDQLAKADVMMLSVGFNNVVPDLSQPPPGGFPKGCDTQEPGVPDPGIALVVATTPECTSKTVALWAKAYDEIFSTMSDLRAGQPTAFIALNVYNGNLNNPDVKAALDAATYDKTLNVIIDIYDQWNAMLCKSAKAHGFTCVDTYHAMNGPDGDHPLGELSSDGAHPSQSGNDLIAALLAKVDAGNVTS